MQLPEQHLLFTEQLPFLDKQDPVGLPTGAGVTGLGVVLEAEHEGFHQQRFPPFPHPLLSFSIAQSPPAGDPSAQMVSGIGSFLEQMYLA